MSTLLQVEGLSVAYDTLEGPLPAVEDMSFSVAAGETVAIVGESGSGKSTVAQALLRLIPRDAGGARAGRVLLDGVDLLALPESALRAVRGARVGMVFQDPAMALNPVQRVGRQIAESLVLHGRLPRGAALERAVELLAQVGVPDPQERARQYPHNLSGGMRQRAMIAMALACEPALLIADEPTTALDVTVQAQVLALLAELKARSGLAVLLITHDLAVVSEVAQRVIVMYAGRKVEEGPVEEVFANPRHPYTQGLLATSDWSGAAAERLQEIPGTVPSLRDLPRGCAFAPRCAHAAERCRAGVPAQTILGRRHSAACVLAEAA